MTPLCRGGAWQWDNLVTCCASCNQRKGSKTIAELGWKLRKAPVEPRPDFIFWASNIPVSVLENPPAEWLDFLPDHLLAQLARIEAGVRQVRQDARGDTRRGPPREKASKQARKQEKARRRRNRRETLAKSAAKNRGETGAPDQVIWAVEGPVDHTTVSNVLN